MKRVYKGEARKALRLKVEKLRDNGMLFKDIGEKFDISGSFAGTLYRESKAPVKLSIMDRLKLWLTFKV